MSCVGLHHDLARESVQARDPAFAIVACEAGVGRPLVARAAARAGASNHGCDEIAARDPCPSRSTRPSSS